MWSFYAERADEPFPARWRGTADFGRSKFGRFPGDPPRYKATASTSSAGHRASR